MLWTNFGRTSDAIVAISDRVPENSRNGGDQARI